MSRVTLVLGDLGGTIFYSHHYGAVGHHHLFCLSTDLTFLKVFGVDSVALCLQKVQLLLDVTASVNLFHFAALDLTQSELVAVVMVLIDVMQCQTCRCSTTLLTACYRQ